MAFKVSSTKMQAKLRRPLLKQFGDFEDEYLTDKEYLEKIRMLTTKIEREIWKLSKGSPERKQLGIKKQILSQEIFRLSPKLGKPGKSLAQCFMDIVRKEDPALFEYYRSLALIEQNRLIEEKHGKLKICNASAEDPREEK